MTEEEVLLNDLRNALKEDAWAARDLSRAEEHTEECRARSLRAWAEVKRCITELVGALSPT